MEKMASASVHSSPTVEITLSRPFYRLGGTVVGTIRVTAPPAPPRPAKNAGGRATQHRQHHPKTNASAAAEQSSLRSSIASLQLTVAGFCRLDPRWHGKDELSQKFDSRKLLSSTTVTNHDEGASDLPPLPSNTAPFWSAGTIELMELRERLLGSWDEVRPKPIVLPERNAPVTKRKLQATLAAAIRGEDNGAAQTMNERHHLAFTFRVDLPHDNEAPHTLVATSCRYYYTVSARLVLNRGPEENDLLSSAAGCPAAVWTEIPITVCTADGSSGERADFDNSTPSPAMQAVAHSSGLPTHLTAAELHRLEGQWTVNRQGAALFRSITTMRGGGGGCGAQSMKVADPSSGRPVCILTIMGASSLHPGSRLLLKLDFPTGYNYHEEDSEWMPCFQASACLQAEEVAISSIKNVRKRARRHLFCTAHQEMDPTTTESISLNLMLPVTAPCSVSNDTVEITTQCLIDIAVGLKQTKNNTTGGYRNLRLEIPCRVTHAQADWERRDDDEEEESPGKQMYEEIVASSAGAQQERSDDPMDPSSFRYKDIVEELKILSLTMADTCGLRPKPRSLQSK